MSADGFAQYVLELLEPMGGMVARKMFGGVGLYQGALFFGIVFDDTLYLRVDDTTRPKFEAAGSRPFTYARGRKIVSMTYYQAPDAALDNAEAMRPWVKGALDAARAKPAKKRPAGKKGAASRKPFPR